MDEAHIEGDLVDVLFSEDDIQNRLGELAAEIENDYEGKDLLLVGVLKGAVMVMADLARHFGRHVEMDWMAISSYGSGTKSSGVVRILKDLDTDISGRHVLVVEDIIDTGLTLSWLVSNLNSRRPASVEICTLLRKPEALQMTVDVEVRRLRHPQRVRRRLRPRLRRALPQPALDRHPRPARLLLTHRTDARGFAELEAPRRADRADRASAVTLVVVGTAGSRADGIAAERSRDRRAWAEADAVVRRFACTVEMSICRELAGGRGGAPGHGR